MKATTLWASNQTEKRHAPGFVALGLSGTRHAPKGHLVSNGLGVHQHTSAFHMVLEKRRALLNDEAKNSQKMKT